MYDTHLSHHGILGQKWGIRRYQNKDGTLTAEGKARLEGYRASENAKIQNKTILATQKYDKALTRAGDNTNKAAKIETRFNKKIDQYMKEMEYVTSMTYDEMKSEQRFKEIRNSGMAFVQGFAFGIYVPGTFKWMNEGAVRKRRLKKMAYED